MLRFLIIDYNCKYRFSYKTFLVVFTTLLCCYKDNVLGTRETVELLQQETSEFI